MKLSATSTSLQLALAGFALFGTTDAFAPLRAKNINFAKFAATIAPDATTITENNSDGNNGDENIRNTSKTPSVEFPPPLTKVQRLERAAKFWSSAIPIVLSYYSKSAELRAKEAFTGTQLTDDEKQLVWICEINFRTLQLFSFPILKLYSRFWIHIKQHFLWFFLF